MGIPSTIYRTIEDTKELEDFIVLFSNHSEYPNYDYRYNRADSPSTMADYNINLRSYEQTEELYTYIFRRFVEQNRARMSNITWATAAPVPVKQGGKTVSTHSVSEEALLLIEKLKNRDETQRIITFQNDSEVGVWVVLKEADFDLQIQYSEIYYSVLEVYPNFKCDFMVYGKDEISSAPIPSNSIIFYQKEGA